MHTAILPVDLLTVVRVAAASNIDILQARNQLEAARGRVDSAVGQLFPTLSPTALFEIVDGNVRATEGNILDVGFSTFRTFLAVDWILNPGRVYYEIVASKKRLAATEHQERAVVIQTIHDAVIEYYDLVLARSR
ncbi:MAG: TolC family protein, partial [Proteobacteria bacterium]|nr:TolC family protein [Pseudomonadota bacterium]